MPGNLFEGAEWTRLEEALPDVLRAQRWFGGKARRVTAVQVVDRIAISSGPPDAVLLLIEVSYGDGGHEIYALPVAWAVAEEASRIAAEMPGAVLHPTTADQAGDGQTGMFYDAMWNDAAVHRLIVAMRDGVTFSGQRGALQASSTPAFAQMFGTEGHALPRVLNGEQSNTSVAFGEAALLKLYRRVQPGVNPDWEIGRYLTSRGFAHSPAVGGAIEYVRSGETATLGLLQAFVKNEGDAWTVMLNVLDGFLARIPARASEIDSEAGRDCLLWELAQQPVPEMARQLLDPALDAAARLGQRTAALHLTLAEESGDPNFAPEPLTPEYRQQRYQSMVRLWQQAMRLLEQRPLLHEAQGDLLNQESRVHGIFQSLLDIERGGQRIRCHGDYHLGQVLWTGSDYVVTDFEGEPARPLSERRLKHSPLFDVAGMLRSLDYASWTALARWQPEDGRRKLERWSAYWSRWVRARYLAEYLSHVRDAPFWPPSSQDAVRLLTIHQLEKAVYELGYELNNRPRWVMIPIRGIQEIVRMSAAQAAA